MNRDLAADRQAALAVPCGYCHAERGEPCTRTDLAGDVHPLEAFPAHLPRLKAGLKAAGVVHAPLDSRDLRRAD